MEDSGVTISYDPAGSGAGREQFIAGGATAYAGSDAALDPKTELAKAKKRCSPGELIQIPVYISPIAMVYNLSGVDKLQLSPETLAKIFNQDITTWNDPAIAADNPDASLPDTRITPVNRSDESGTTENFTDYLSKAAPDVWTYEVSGDWPVKGGESASGTSGVIDAVKNGEGTVGYADASQAGDLGVATVKVGSEFVGPTAEAAAAIVDESPQDTSGGQYVFSYALDRTTTAQNTYPIILASYELACTQYPTRTRPTSSRPCSATRSARRVRTRRHRMPARPRSPTRSAARSCLRWRRSDRSSRDIEVAQPEGFRRSTAGPLEGSMQPRSRSVSASIDTTTNAGQILAPGSGGKGRGADRIFSGLATAAGVTILVLLAGVAIFLAVEAAPAITASSSELAGGKSLISTIAPLVFGTVLAAAIAVLIAVPMAAAVALFISHIAPRRLAQPLGYLVDLLAAIPSIVYGLWGIAVLGPASVSIARWLSDNLGFIPFFAGPASPTGRTMLVVGVVLAVMILPIISAVAREVFSQTPKRLQEGALALGATRWEMIRMTVLPFGRSALISGSMLGLGRALGETMAVAIILSGSGLVTFNLISSGNPSTIAANIALDFPESSGIDVNALIASGLVLFAITLVVNIAARAVISRQRTE